MNRSRNDRLTVFDLVVMVAATAPALAVVRHFPDYIAIQDSVTVLTSIEARRNVRSTGGRGWPTTAVGKRVRSTGFPFHRRPSYWLGHVPCWAGPCVMSATLAATALGLRGPRPCLRGLARRPGMAAGFAVIVALGVETLQSVRFLTTSGAWKGFVGEVWWTYLLVASNSTTRLAGYTVAVWWAGLALSGRWSADRNAGARLARCLGWALIAMAASSELGLWCFALNG